MIFIILFTDNPDADPTIRQTHMARHLQFLEENADAIQAAGPLLDADGTGQGGLWVVRAETEEQVTQLIHTDPLWPTGLRAGFTIRTWRRVFADGARLIEPR